VLPMMRATFLGTMSANVAIVNAAFAIDFLGLGEMGGGFEEKLLLDMRQVQVETGESELFS
jgi:hypothetical protein